MEREHFNTLLTNFAALTAGECKELIVLSKKFPYSQVIHNLSARAAQDCALPGREKLLHTSAIYSTDRAALKMVITTPRAKRMEAMPIKEEDIKPTAEIIVEVENTGTAIHEQILIDLANLQESKRVFEMTIAGLEKEKARPLAERKEDLMATKPKETDSLIEEIKSTKKKIKPEGAKQIEQIEIIDQFIKTQPSIARPKQSTHPTADNDLAEPGTQFGENIVSETLVEILLKQGKKEKAIEALKKLIWKFPQKKAYFAAQIEELRK